MHKASKTRVTETMGLVFTRPLREFDLSNFDYVSLIYNQFDKHGTLPFQGSLTDQPNKIIESLNVVRGLVQEQIQKQEKKQAQMRR